MESCTVHKQRHYRHTCCGAQGGANLMVGGLGVVELDSQIYSPLLSTVLSVMKTSAFSKLILNVPDRFFGL